MSDWNRNCSGFVRCCEDGERLREWGVRERWRMYDGDYSTRSNEESLVGQKEIWGIIDMQNDEGFGGGADEEVEAEDKFSEEFENSCIFRSENFQESESSLDKQEKISKEDQKDWSEQDDELKLPEIEEIKPDKLNELTKLEEEPLKESKYLFRPDNVRKATIRALNKVVKTHVNAWIEDYKRKTGIKLKRYFAKYRNEVYQCFKTCIEKILGYSLSEIDTKEVYAIMFYFCLKKKKPVKTMIKFFNREERNFIASALERYKKQGRAYTKEDGEYCFNHIMMKIAKNLYFSNDEYKEIFKKQVLDTTKKVGIINSQEYLNRLINEMNYINSNPQ